MRVLLVSPFCPWPPMFGGAQRTLAFARALGARHEVTLTCRSPSPAQVPDVDAARRDAEARLRPHVRRILWGPATPSYTVPAQPTGSRLGNIVGDLVDLLMHRTPLEFREVEPAWRALVEQHGAEFDAALVRYSHLLPLVAGLPQRRVVVDADDLRFLLLARRGRSHGFVTRVSHLLEAGRSWAHEQRLFRRVAHVITCSADDRALVRSARASVLPNGVAVEAVADAPRAAATLVFVGQCDWRPNRRGVAWFLREVWPLVRAAHPAARFQVVGQRAARTTFGVEELEGVSYHADVPSVAPWFAGASASIVPLWEGGGTRIKVIESLAYGTPVVATSLGAAGLRSRFTPALGLELADAPAAMAARIADLFANPGAALARAAAGQAVVLREFSWASILARLPDDLPRWVGDG